MRFDLGNDEVAYAKIAGEARSGELAARRRRPDQRRRRLPAGAAGVRHTAGSRTARRCSTPPRYIGGLYVSRSHKGDAKAPKPLEVVPAERQREALELLEEQVFNDKPFNFPPELYNELAASHWDHWGTQTVERGDYPVHEVILMWQDRIVSRLLSSLTLARLHDSELKVPADTDVLTSAELIQRLTKAIYSEVDNVKEGEFTNRKPAISSLRRNLQRAYLRRLSELALGNTGARPIAKPSPTPSSRSSSRGSTRRSTAR